jgi:hypothetical protein
MTAIKLDSPLKRRQWQRTDKAVLTKTLEESLGLTASLCTKDDIDRRVQEIVGAITAAIEILTSKARPCERSIPEWTQECKDAQMMARRLRRIYQRTQSERDWEAYREARNYKTRIIEKTLRNAHRSRVEEASSTQEGLWRLARRPRKREIRHSFTPPLRRADGTLEHEHGAKAEMLREAFFPPPPEVDLSDIEGYTYPNRVEFQLIMDTEVVRVIK